ncbi:MAG: glycosyl transferase group 1 [Flavobacteriales bacterium]|mgnify:CR=1 FL=1|nr:glycosyl transferase group 1 [Flavobacteriales bacterium]
MKKVIISVTNDLNTDQRVDKVANSLLDNGFSVLLVGRKIRNFSSPLISRSYDCHRFSLIFDKGFLFYLEFNIRLFFFLFFKKSDILLSNDLDTLLPNFLVSKLKRKKLVYDSHELFVEVPELIHRPIVKRVWLLLEQFCLPRIRYSYTVSTSIANYYHEKYNINMSVVRNFPFYQKIDVSTLVNDKKIIYQGAVNQDRGVDLMIAAMQYVDAKLYIAGTGDVLDQMVDYVIKLNLDKKVIFLGQVPFQKLSKITQSASLGLSFEEDTCLAYRYSLPNKIFDYIHAEIPVLISNLPEFISVIKKYDVGMVLSSRDPKEVASQINTLISSDRKHMLPKIKLAKKDLCWENEQKKLLSLFT